MTLFPAPISHQAAAESVRMRFQELRKQLAVAHARAESGSQSGDLDPASVDWDLAILGLVDDSGRPRFDRIASFDRLAEIESEYLAHMTPNPAFRPLRPRNQK
jgi:hypothetical protein